jgi:DNA-binding NtrC family response regulator
LGQIVAAEVLRPFNLRHGKTAMYSESTILVLSGGSNESETIARMLADHYRVIEADNPEDALTQLSNGVDVVVAELEGPQSSALELLRRGKTDHPGKPFLAVANRGDVDTAVAAMKLGAADCLVKPVMREQLQTVVSRLIEESQQKTGPESGSDTQSKHGSNIDIPPGTSLEDLERAAVEQALAQHQGNRTHAAKTLGISVRTLQRKLKAWGIPVVPLQHSSPTNNFVLPTHAVHSGHTAYSAHAH